MLKITTFRTDQRCRLVLEGKLFSQWVAGLKREWDDTRISAPKLTLIVDLRNVTTISQEGENLLLGMMREGVRFVCGKVLKRHVLQQLARERTANLEYSRFNESRNDNDESSANS